MALKLGNQILTNEDEVCVPSLSSILLAVQALLNCVVGLEKIDTQKYYHAYTLLDFWQLWSAKLKRQKISWNIAVGVS